MSDDPLEDWQEPDGPVLASAIARPRLTGQQRIELLGAVVGPMFMIGLALSPFAFVGGRPFIEVVVASVVYGGLLGMAGGFVYVDRVQARACPRCAQPFDKGAVLCRRCGYDVENRPRFLCDERHAVYLDPGLCECGRRLLPLPVARGVGREVAVTLKIGAGLLVFLLVMGFLLTFLDGS